MSNHVALIVHDQTSASLLITSKHKSRSGTSQKRSLSEIPPSSLAKLRRLRSVFCNSYNKKQINIHCTLSSVCTTYIKNSQL